MLLPHRDQIMLPILRKISEGVTGNAELVEFFSEQFGLNEQERGKMAGSSRQTIVQNEVYFASGALGRAKLIEKVSRTGPARYDITARGRELLRDPPPQITVKFLRGKYPGSFPPRTGEPPPRAPKPIGAPPPEPDPVTAAPSPPDPTKLGYGIDDIIVDGCFLPKSGSDYDHLEPEVDDDEQQARDDDTPVVSKPADWTITSLREKWEAGLLNLQPTFQREYVWRLRPELRSRLIESILLEIPIPPLYFGRQRGGTLEVIDGQQRITTLIQFIGNDFPLQRLTRMPSLNGKVFRELSREHKEKIKDTPIRTIVIDAGNNMDLRYEIFERLNRGSMALNEQELRNCVYRGPFNDLLARLEKEQVWRKIKGGDEPGPRFIEREMILRILALANRAALYTGSALKRFLNEYMERHAPQGIEAIEEQSSMFRQTMQNVLTVFGSHSGRLYTVSSGSCNGSWGSFSIAVLEIQASALLRQNPVRVQRVADQIREHFIFLLLTNEKLRDAIWRATAGSAPTRMRWTLFRSLIQPIIDGVEVEPRFFSYQFRKQLFDASPVCALCSNQILSFEDSAVDHKIPYSRNGKTVVENGQLSHRFCNAIKNAGLDKTEPG